MKLTKLEKEILGRCQTERSKKFMRYVFDHRNHYDTVECAHQTGVTPRQQGSLRASFADCYGFKWKKVKNCVYRLESVSNEKSERYYKAEARKIIKRQIKESFGRVDFDLINRVFA